MLAADETPVNLIDARTGLAEEDAGAPHVLVIRTPYRGLTWLRALGSRQAAAITAVLAFFTGFLISDGYSAYQQLLASGATIPIANLKPGDKVLATNTKTGRTQPEAVTAVMVNHDTDLYDLKIKSGGQMATIHTTRSHLFWDVTRHRWVKAISLRHGERLRAPAGGTAIVTGGYAPQQSQGWMWDLTIAIYHDFYIDTMRVIQVIR